LTIADLFDLAIATLNLSKSVNAFLALCLAIFCPHLDAANSAAAPLCAAANAAASGHLPVSNLIGVIAKRFKLMMHRLMPGASTKTLFWSTKSTTTTSLPYSLSAFKLTSATRPNSMFLCCSFVHIGRRGKRRFGKYALPRARREKSSSALPRMTLRRRRRVTSRGFRPERRRENRTPSPRKSDRALSQ